MFREFLLFGKLDGAGIIMLFKGIMTRLKNTDDKSCFY